MKTDKHTIMMVESSMEHYQSLSTREAMFEAAQEAVRAFSGEKGLVFRMINIAALALLIIERETNGKHVETDNANDARPSGS